MLAWLDDVTVVSQLGNCLDSSYLTRHSFYSWMNFLLPANHFSEYAGCVLNATSTCASVQHLHMCIYAVLARVHFMWHRHKCFSHGTSTLQGICLYVRMTAILLRVMTRNLYSLPIEAYNNFIKKDLYSTHKTVEDAELKQINKIHYVDRTGPYDPRTPHFT